MFPDAVICSCGRIPTFGTSGLNPYKKWRLIVCKSDERFIFPLGGSGTLYPPHSLYKDVTDSSLFMNLAPQADDVWFWVMALMNGTRTVLSGLNRMYRQIDLLYQLTHKNSSLKETNIGENRNDVQIAAVLNHYGIQTDKRSMERLIEDKKQ